MAVVARKRRSGVVYFVATKWKRKVYYERVGVERREAERLSERRKREVKAGTYEPPALRQGWCTVATHFTRWAEGRRTRSAKAGNEAYLVGYVLRVEWFGALAIDTVRPRHVIALAKELQASGLAPKTVTNAITLLGVAMRDAVIAEVISTSPVVLPRGLLSKRFVPTVPYDAAEVARLLALPGIHGALAALALYTGMRPGEIAGRRWRDIDEHARPLAALSVASQYYDLPLKGDDHEKARPRRVPVHPELAKALEAWRDRWPIEYAADPGPEDWILPSRRGARDRSQPYTRGGIYQLWKQACTLASVKPRELRATRNTWVTFARRASPRTDMISEISHNSKGAIIDIYNRFQWGPLCDVINALSFAGRYDEIEPGADASESAQRDCTRAPAMFGCETRAEPAA